MKIGEKIKKAEAYLSIGLLDKSLDIYEEVMSVIPESQPEKLAILKRKIQLIKTELNDRKIEETRDIHSDEQGNALMEAAIDLDDAPEILQTASALKEMGLSEWAAEHYERLFELDFDPAEAIPGLIQSILEVEPPEKVVKRVQGLIEKHVSDLQKKAQSYHCLGQEMEKMGNRDQAVDIYRIASGIDPQSREIQNKLRSLDIKLPSGSRYSDLLKRNIITKEQLQKARDASKKAKKSVEFVLIDQFKVEKEEVGKSLSSFYKSPFKAFDPDTPIPAELTTNLKRSFLLHDVWVPLSWSKDGVEVLVDDPMDLRKTDQIEGLIKSNKINFSVGIKEDIIQFIKLFYDKNSVEPLEEMVEELDMLPDISFEEEEATELEEQDYFLDESSSKVVKLVDQILVMAYRMNVSDIHIEPSPITKSTAVRLRMDGVCQEYLQVPLSLSRGILSKLKIMAELDIAERRLPQDGKIKFKRKGVPAFELRLSTMPTAGGFEDAVLRILAKAGSMKLDEMGLNERNLEIVEKIVSMPYGLILVVGPTGSGKTTTLHACLGHINKPGIKIWTAEDPVEITQPGLRQVEVKPRIGLDFSRVMRGFLRLDPDVIMIGEMRDQETASIGIEASLTGHLVFSTLHTNSAPETVTRLLDMGLNPLNFSDAFLGVLAQRLVRRLCMECREEYNPSEEEFQEIVTAYGPEQFEATKIEFTPELTLYRPRGCDLCSGSGYRGRMGIHELMEGTPQIKSMVKTRATSEQLFEQATKDGMTSLKQDAIVKIFEGFTDFTEVKRVCVT